MKREANIDIAKGIAIFLMVVGHCYHEYNVILKLIYAFHMPFFFIITGVLYSKDRRLSIRKQCIRLLIPYAYFELMYSIMLLFLSIVSKSSGSWMEFTNRLLMTLKLSGVTVTWYLPCLLIAEIVFVMLKKQE